MSANFPPPPLGAPPPVPPPPGTTPPGALGPPPVYAYWQPPPQRPRQGSRLGIYLFGLALVGVVAVLIVIALSPPPTPPRCEPPAPVCKPDPPPPKPGPSSPAPSPVPTTQPAPGSTPVPTQPPEGAAFVNGEHWSHPTEGWGFWYFKGAWRPVETRGDAAVSLDDGLESLDAKVDIWSAPAADTSVDGMLAKLLDAAKGSYEAVGPDPASEPNERVMRPTLGYLPAQARVLRGTTAEGGAGATVSIVHLAATDGTVVIGIQIVVQSPADSYIKDCGGIVGNFHCPTKYRVIGTLFDDIRKRFEWTHQ